MAKRKAELEETFIASFDSYVDARLAQEDYMRLIDVLGKTREFPIVIVRRVGGTYSFGVYAMKFLRFIDEGVTSGDS